MRISLRRLRYFQAIALTGSLTAAAKQLEIAQPALSHHIQKLEKEFGVKLLVRNNRGVTLTPSGFILSEHAGEILRKVEEAENALISMVDAPIGKVVVALAVIMARHLVPVLIDIVNKKYPHINLNILDVSNVTAIDYMKSETADLALVPNAAEIPNVDAQAVYREPFYLIERSDGKKNDASISFERLAKIPLVIFSRNSDTRRRVEEAAMEGGHQLNISYEQDSVEIIRSMVLAGLAATVTQSTLFHPTLERPMLNIRKIENPGIIRTHAIVHKSGHPPSLAVKAVEMALIEAISILVNDGTFPGEICK